jgi:hypothetical protein
MTIKFDTILQIQQGYKSMSCKNENFTRKCYKGSKRLETLLFAAIMMTKKERTKDLRVNKQKSLTFTTKGRDFLVCKTQTIRSAIYSL